jgi:2-oxoglutarate ferredoxin oxidoreductase subunit delta
MAYIKIDFEGCKACGLCMEFCPKNCIVLDEEMNSRGFHPASFTNPENCTGCRTCAVMCPDVCIEVFREEKVPTAKQAEQ